MRAARLRTWRIPRPPIRMRSPFLRCLVTKPTSSPRTDSACFLDISCDSARLAARCFNVTVGADPAFLGAVAMDDPPRCRGVAGEATHHTGRLDDSTIV